MRDLIKRGLLILIILILIFLVLKFVFGFWECVSSDEQCEGKSDGELCSMGVWCDIFGRSCGGDSCAGMGKGECLSGVCKSDDALS